MFVHKKVEYKGEIYWLHSSEAYPGYVFNISPLEHYNEEGELQPSAFLTISFAILVGDNIMQDGHIIGNKFELKDVE